MKEIVHTKGNVVVNDIEVGDIHYEYDYGCGIKCEVISIPERREDGIWTWKSKNVNTGQEIDYLVNEKYPHYSVNLYDYEAYHCNQWV